MPVDSRWVHLTVPESDSMMEGYLAWPSADRQGNRLHGPWPAVLVMMEIFGINDHIQAVTRRIADNGYVALAINYYHRTTANLNLSYDDEAVLQGRIHKSKTTAAGILADTQAAVQYLKSMPEVSPRNKMGCIGFCFGGHVAYLAATLPDIAATAAMYGAAIASAPLADRDTPTITDTPNIHGHIKVFYGEQDSLIPAQETQIVESALKSSSISHEVIRYGQAGHGFCCDARPDYVPSIAHDAWQRIFAMWDQTLKSSQKINR